MASALRSKDLMSSQRCCTSRVNSPTVQIEFDLEAGLPPVSLDAAQFEAALLNLVINARDAMPDGGRIDVVSRLRTAPDGSRSVVVSVRDTGVGMPPEVLARALDPFFTTKEVGEGSGLGLSQVYGTVSSLGGTVTIDSEPGKGTNVTMSFPVTEPERPGGDALAGNNRHVDDGQPAR